MKGTVKVAASHQKRPAKNANGEYAAFSAALKKILSVSPTKLKSDIEAEKLKKQSKRACRALDV
jgi:hypothetical protein